MVSPSTATQFFRATKAHCSWCCRCVSMVGKKFVFFMIACILFPRGTDDDDNEPAFSAVRPNRHRQGGGRSFLGWVVEQEAEQAAAEALLVPEQQEQVPAVAATVLLRQGSAAVAAVAVVIFLLGGFVRYRRSTPTINHVNDVEESATANAHDSDEVAGRNVAATNDFMVSPSTATQFCRRNRQHRVPAATATATVSAAFFDDEYESPDDDAYESPAAAAAAGPATAGPVTAAGPATAGPVTAAGPATAGPATVPITATAPIPVPTESNPSNVPITATAPIPVPTESNPPNVPITATVTITTVAPHPNPNRNQLEADASSIGNNKIISTSSSTASSSSLSASASLTEEEEEDKTARALLKRHGFDPDDLQKTDKYGSTPMNYFCYLGDVTMVRYLIARGVNWRKSNKCGRFFMFMAAEFGHLEIMKLLLYHGGAHEDLRAKRRSRSPVRVALHNGHFRVVRWLIRNRALTPRDHAEVGGIDDRVMRKALWPLHDRFRKWGYDKRTIVLSWAQNVVTDYDNFQLFLTGTVLYSNDDTGMSLSSSSTPGVMETISQFVAGTAQSVRTFRQLMDRLPEFIEDVPFVEE